MLWEVKIVNRFTRRVQGGQISGLGLVTEFRFIPVVEPEGVLQELSEVSEDVV